jgi:DNA-binding NtrC family response regulator
MALILVVDDDRGMKLAVRFIASKHWPEHECIGVSRSSTALDILRNQPVALCISDIRRPGESGLDLITEALSVQPALVFIILSGNANPENAQTAIERGAFAAIPKPFCVPEFVGLLGEALAEADRRRLGAASIDAG